MMELFALIVKQDGGMLQSERDFVSAFLTKQLPHQSADEFMHLFLQEAGAVREKERPDISETASVKDSIRILNNCKKINKTLPVLPSDIEKKIDKKREELIRKLLGGH